MTTQNQTITPVQVAGQTELQQYGVDADGSLYLFSPSLDEWSRENLATQMVREARANGKRSSIETEQPAWRFGENWMTRQRGR